MTNFPIVHERIRVSFSNGSDKTFENSKLIITGNSMLIVGNVTRDEETQTKEEAVSVYELKLIQSYKTSTKYHPQLEQLGGNKEILKD